MCKILKLFARSWSPNFPIQFSEIRSHELLYQSLCLLFSQRLLLKFVLLMLRLGELLCDTTLQKQFSNGCGLVNLRIYNGHDSVYN